MKKIKVLIITGDGVNCENETKRAFELCGSHVKGQVVHINDLKDMNIASFSIIALPGGFSYGDELGSGKVFSLKLGQFVGKQLKEFVKAGKPIIGICNGFQVLTKLGIFNDDVSVGLTSNESGQFINKWSDLVVHESHCVWTKGISDLRLPIRHGEGRFVFGRDHQLHLQRWKDLGRVTLTYKNNPNGAHGSIAGVTDSTGLVFGLMPHPEAAVNTNLYPGGKLVGNLGLEIFKNAVEYIDNSGVNNE
jgi:phosphoribosylformylglycinamidine synthase I